MAGNKDAWRDIFSASDWGIIQLQAAQARRQPMMGVSRGAPPVAVSPVGGGWKAAAPNTNTNTAANTLTFITQLISAYHAIPKDDSTKFDERILKLKNIKVFCDKYITQLGSTHTLGNKTMGGKQLTDQIDVWVTSLGKRAIKKAGYLEEMKEWHRSAKNKYKDKLALTTFLLQLAGDNTRETGEKLHATPYATIEKIDPYHRQTFLFLDPATNSADPANEMGTALVDYLYGQPACNPDRATNPNASFYEWLEYHLFCTGTPGVTPGYNLSRPNRVTYDNLDLAHVFMPPDTMQYVRLVTNPVARQPLDTSTFGQSGKGPPNSAAFVWDQECHLWMHEHGANGFVHASAKQGKKIRCSGMMVARNGKATCITNQSGHYQPNAKSIYYFVEWLRARNCIEPNARIVIEHDSDFAASKTLPTFLLTASGKFGPAPAQPYHS